MQVDLTREQSSQASKSTTKTLNNPFVLVARAVPSFRCLQLRELSICNELLGQAGRRRNGSHVRHLAKLLLTHTPNSSQKLGRLLLLNGI